MPTNQTNENYRKPAGKMSPRIVLVSIVGALLATTSLAQANGKARKESLSLLQAPYPRHSPPAVPSKVNSFPRQEINEATHSSYPRNHFQRGMYLHQIGRSDDALIEFLKATQENPRLVQAFYEQALIFRERGYLRLAESALEQALAVKHDYQQARILLATIRLQQGNVHGAVAELTQSLGLPTVPVEVTSNKSAESAKQGPSPTENAPVIPRPHFPAVMQTPHALLPEPESLPSLEYYPHPQNAPSTQTHFVDNPLANPTLGQADRYPNLKKPDCNQPKFHFGLPNPLKLIKLTWPHKTQNINLESIQSPHSQLSKVNHQEGKHRRLSSWFTKLFSTTNGDHPNKRAYTTAEAEKKTTQRKQKVIVKASKAKPNMRKSELLPMVIHQPPSEPLSEITHNSADPNRSKTTATQSAQTIKPVSINQAPHPPAVSAANPVKTRVQDNLTRKFQQPMLPDSGNRLLALAQNEKLPIAYLHQTASHNIDKDLIISSQTHQQVTDAWSERLQYLVEHGTASLRHGEAFMFSEDTGEAVLFLAGGETVRRKIAPEKDPDEVVRVRRPDIAFPQELKYNLSLLAKLLPPQHEPAQEQEQQPGKFTINELLGKPDGFWGWLKSLLTL